MKHLSLLIATGTLILAQNSMALIAIGDVPATEVLTGVNGSIVVGEFDQFPSGHYFLDVVGQNVAPIYGFAVSSGSGEFARTGRSGWSAVALSPAQWDAGYTIGDGDFDTKSLGSFLGLFGPNDSGVNLYFNNGVVAAGQDITESSDQDQSSPGFWNPTLLNDSNNQFSWDAVVASSFVAFGNTGTIIDRGPVSSVPDAGSTFGLAALSIVALGFARRRWAVQ